MRRVVFIINSLAGGGAERIMARLLANSKSVAADTELHLVLLDIEPAAYTVPDWVTVHQLDTRGSLLGGFSPLFRLIGTLKPQICVSFLTRANLLAIATARLKGIRCVISERVNTSSHHPQTLAGKLARFMTWAFYRHADRIIAVSGGIASDLSNNYGVPAARISVIPNPVDGQFVRDKGAEPVVLDHPRPLVVGMGRLVPNKNFAMLIDAFAQRAGAGTLLILGEGPLKDDLAAQIERLGLQGRVLLPGFQANPFAIIAAADCYVLPSNGEGFPNGLVEAMVLGTPVVSTNCHSGPAEILDDRPYFEVTGVNEAKYGILVPTNDADALAQAMTIALAPGQRDRLSALALQGAARYGLEATVGRYWNAIEGRE